MFAFLGHLERRKNQRPDVITIIKERERERKEGRKGKRERKAKKEKIE